MEIADLYIYTSIALSAAFTTLVIFIIIGFFRVRNAKYEPLNQLTVLIAFKNESKLIRPFLSHLRNVIPSDSSLIVRFLNDHSDDLSPQLIDEIEKDRCFQILTIPADLNGKKSTVNYGIEQATTPWVLLLDMDTFPARELFRNRNNLIPKGAKMTLVPLHPKRSGGAISAFFALDFLSLHFTGLSMARLRIPVLANAAALFLNRDAYLQASKIRTDWNEPSGDDIFAMMAIKKIFGSKAIGVVPHLYPLASVVFPNKFKDLWNQRFRWISKVGKVENYWFQVVSWVVLLVQITVIIGFLYLLMNGIQNVVTVALAAIFISEISLLGFASVFAQRTALLGYLIPAVLIYPFYLLALITASAFKRPSWK